VGAQSHLLNMSKSSVRIAEDDGVTIDLALDLLATAGSRDTYWAWSQLDTPLESPDVQTALAPLPTAIALASNGTAVPLTLQSLSFPKLSKDEYLDPLGWPRAKLTLRGQIQRPATAQIALQVSYTDAFRFEEPIANTLIDEKNDRKQTRWLVTGQRSPTFLLQGKSVATAESVGERNSIAQTSRDAGVTEARAVFIDLLRAGFRHIFPDGIDHMLFVAALFFGSASLTALIGIITLFTLAHSVSLGMMALGWLSAPAAVVEPLILLSIIWVAGSNLRYGARRPASYWVVLLFGIVHGLGFASALRDIGLPSDFLLTGLAAFNLGVEIAQLGFLLTLALLMYAFRRLVPAADAPRRYGSIAVIVATSMLIGWRFL